MPRKRELLLLGHRMIVLSAIAMVDFQTAVPPEDRHIWLYFAGAGGWRIQISMQEARIVEEALREYYGE